MNFCCISGSPGKHTSTPDILQMTQAIVSSVCSIYSYAINLICGCIEPQKPWFIHLLAEATAKGIVIVNISQCQTGMVEMARYETGLHLLDAGVISGFDATVESVLTKLMFLFGHNLTPKEVRNEMNRSIAGEFTRPEL